MDDGFKQLVGGMKAEAQSPPWRTELEARIATLEERLEHLEKDHG